MKKSISGGLINSRNKHFGIKLVLAGGLSAALLLLADPGEKTFADNDKIAELEAKIANAKEEKEKTQNEISEGKIELDSLTSTADSLKGELSNLNTELNRVSDHLSGLEQQIADKNALIADTEEALREAVFVEEEQYKAMKQRIRYMYEKKNYDAVESLFGAANFSEFLNRSEYFSSLTSYDRMKLEEYRHTRKVIEEARALLVDEREELDELHEATEDEQDRVSELVAKTAYSIGAYESEIEQTEAEIAEEEAILAEQDKSIRQLQAELAEERRLSELARRSAWRDISEVSFAEGDRYLLANLIWSEAGNQSYDGQLGVGAVVMNRVMSSVFPDTVVGVIYQKNQFSPARSGRLAMALANNSATSSCYAAADAAMAGQTNVGNCLFFRTPIPGLTGIQIDGHIFY